MLNTELPTDGIWQHTFDRQPVWFIVYLRHQQRLYHHRNVRDAVLAVTYQLRVHIPSVLLASTALTVDIIPEVRATDICFLSANLTFSKFLTSHIFSLSKNYKLETHNLSFLSFV